ncbi:hypothetical protein VOLCADRAFT_103709 [Volvox carteri f. nagariensis]|uniref:Uncharacterized protein n=1 Tax=Volvox carteri f. nagariensis TaxID=3068 RepID=D8TNY5_VOLCA|nr:uncharacterized protein VOLCADRAFT_103709 [Volvox carteri f. nagariensis]EFJ50923.1 hypothetical protein VOLCADRAFT_103709 [Volvox carteri f. nagariensis]|eukprot:XP_002947935.1 hypothetical protein VOLCADRAFT_103709 [Volvox carteri f. nagariensis]
MADKDAAASTGRGGGRAGARKFMPTMPGRRKKAEEGGAAAAGDAGVSDEAFKDLIKQAQSAATGGRGRGRGRHQQQRFLVTFGVGGEERPALAAAKHYARSGGAGGGGGGAGGGGAGGGGGSGNRVKTEGAGADEEPLPDLPDAKPADVKSIKPRPAVLDYTQYYPTMLPLRVPGEEIWEEAEGGPGFLPSALDLAGMPDVPQRPGEDLDLFDPEMEDQMFLMQMPAVLPLQPGRGGGAAAAGEAEGGGGGGGGGGAAGPGPSSERRRKEAAAAAANRAPGCNMRELPSGRIGKLLVFRSGKVQMQVGDVLLDVSIGLPNQHRQDVVALNPSSNACVLLGDVTQRVLVSPDVLQLLREDSVPEFRRAPEELPDLTRAHRKARGYDDIQQQPDGAPGDVAGIKIKTEASSKGSISAEPINVLARAAVPSLPSTGQQHPARPHPSQPPQYSYASPLRPMPPPHTSFRPTCKAAPPLSPLTRALHLPWRPLPSACLRDLGDRDVPLRAAGGAADGGEAAEGDKPRKGRRSRKEREKEEARDLLESQQIDMEVLEEFKARAAAEEEARRATMGDASEDDPRRLNFHRSLLAASQRGLTAECARIIEAMSDAGLAPGPRAIHVWAYSYIQIGDGPGAKRTAEAGREAYGISWIPETYVALMHGALSATPGGPDLLGALQLWVAQQDAGANPQLGFTFLTKELFRMRYSALAMQVVSEGYAAGLQPDEKLAALVIEQLCKQGLMEEARAEMQRLLDAGLLVGPDHYDTIVRLEAARGNLGSAREMLQNFYTDQRFAPPRASSYTALLKGLVSALRPSGGSSPPTGPPGEDEEQPGESGSGGGGGGRLVLEPDQLDQLLTALREEMVARGLRPGRDTYAAMVEAFAVVGDLDSALAAYETMNRAKGTPALLRKKYLGQFMSRREVDGVVLGMGGCVVTEEGLWVPPAKMTLGEMRVELTAGGMEASAAAGLARKELQKLIKERRERLPSNLLEMQARLEATVAAQEEAEEERRAAEMEENVYEGEEEYDDDEPDMDTLDVNIASIIADEGTFEGGDSLEESATFLAAAGGKLVLTEEAGRAERAGAEGDGEEDEHDDVRDRDDDLDEEDDMEEGFAEDTPAAASRKRRQRRRRGAAAAAAAVDDDDIADLDLEDEDEEYDDGDVDDDDEELLGLEDDGSPPLGDGLGPASSAAPEDLDWEVERGGGEEGEDDAIILDQLLSMSVMDSSRYNDTAGMVVAMRMLELWVAVGCSPTPPDLMMLYEGATLEEHPRCCADLAEQLPALLVAGEVSREQLSEMLVTLANVCLRPGSADSEAADRVVTVMEDNKLQVPADVYSGLEAALGGRPRMRDSVLGVAGGRLEDTDMDLTGSGLESSVSVVGDEEDEGEGGEGVLEGVLGAGEGEEEEEEEEGGAEEEGEGEEEELELYGEYEEDPAQLEAEQLELQRLFQQDGEEDDAWLDELDDTTDLEEVRAAAEAEAEAARQAEMVAATLESVRARNPLAAALLERQLAAMQQAAEALAEAEAADEAEGEEEGQLPAEAGTEAGAGGIVPYGAGGMDGAEGWEAEEDAEEGGEGEEEEGGDLADLGAMAMEAEWDASAVLELPPVVLAEAAAATEADLDETGGLEEEDRILLRRIASKARVLAQLSALNDMAAQAHPDGAAAADAEVTEALRRVRQAMAEGAAATSIIAAAAAAAGETPASLAAAAADEAGLDAVGLELEEAEEAEEGEGEDVLLPEHLEPGVDEEALDGPAKELLHSVMAEAEAILAAEEAEEEAEAEEEDGGAGEAEWEEEEEEGAEFDGLTVGAEETAADAAMLRRLLEAADQLGPELNEEQQELYDMLERGDTSSLESKVGPEVMSWLAEDLQRLAAQEEVELQEGPMGGLAEQQQQQPQQGEEEEEEELGDGVPELPLGWRLNDRFMDTFAAVLRERAAAAAERGIADDGPEVAAVDALLAMAYGYRPQGAADLQEEEEEEDRWQGEGEEVDEELETVQREAREALQALAKEMGGPGEAAAREAAERALEEVMAVQTERYEEAKAEEEAGPRVQVPLPATAAAAAAAALAAGGLEEGPADWEEEGEGEEEEGEERGGAGSGFKVSEAVPPEVAAALLQSLRPVAGPVYFGAQQRQQREEEEEEEEEDGGLVGTSTAAVAEMAPQAEEEEEEAEEEEPPVRGKGRGRSGSGPGSARARRGFR